MGSYKQYLKKGASPNGGTGVFTTVKIPANTMIIEFSGVVYTANQLTAEKKNEYLQVGVNTYMGMSGDFDDYINHNCQPNCRLYIVGERAILYSMYQILPNNELTVDYSCNSTATTTTQCNCSSYQCRKQIGSFNSLSSTLQMDYKEKNAVPMYILKPTLFLPKD